MMTMIFPGIGSSLSAISMVGQKYNFQSIHLLYMVIKEAASSLTCLKIRHYEKLRRISK
jgi:hypothetical protein